MGNSIGGGKKKTAKVMKIDGTTFRLKPPVQARDVLRDHPRHDLLDAEEVKRLSLRAQPLGPYQPLVPGKLYFLVELPRLPDRRAPRRAWSGALEHVTTARDRLESLKLTRRSVSDLSFAAPSSEAASVEESADGGVRLRMRLPKAEVARLVEESKDAAEVAEKIVKLYVSKEGARPAPAKLKKEKRTRFLPMPEEIIA
ncbi:uncharacterized protein M6B38_244965 [Iris pallida]|uniref:Uncharacterized protein n=1 Tax=Iris pallida TaxID=29817 RepID=A0AAX6DI82_IRIPA|nr:uncharacterized protein M6B38_244965 [Iris pallida]